MNQIDFNSILSKADGYIVLVVKDGRYMSFLHGSYMKIVDRIFDRPNKSKSFAKETTNKKQKEV